jgi:hypothetical protein
MTVRISAYDLIALMVSGDIDLNVFDGEFDKLSFPKSGTSVLLFLRED